MPLAPGDTLGRYLIEGVIGHGGMGSVYRALDTRLQRNVALKVLAEEEGGGAGNLPTGGAPRILREARIAAKLEHPNVVAIYDVDETPEGLAYLAMELVEGRPLRACVGDPSVPMLDRMGWLTEVARGLAAAHERGLVHRDVKPENVMIRRDGVAKILDFGIARQVGGGQGNPLLSPNAASVAQRDAATTVTGEGLVLGTPFYMSPEQMKGERVDARSDQFSWGVMAYELLAGAPPWGTDLAPVQVVAAILGTDPPPLSVRNGVPARLSETVQRAMAKSAADRFASMRDVVTRLEEGSDAHPMSARGRLSGRSAIVPVRAGRSLFRPALSGVAVVVVLLGAGWLASRSRGRAAVTSAAPPPVVARCKSNVACTRTLGAPALCIDGACAPIASPDCHASADEGALASDATLWFGALHPLTGDAATMGQNIERATDLGRQDFAEAAGGLNAGGVSARPMALVSCDDAVDPARAAKHMVEDLHVPAIIGFRSGETLLHLASTLFTPHHVLAMATMTPSPLITEVPRLAGETPLVWRTTFNLTAGATVVSELIATVLEPQLHAEGAGRTRVALVRTKARGSLVFAERFFNALSFNGESALSNRNDYEEVVVDPDEDPPHEIETALARLRDLAPNVIVYTGDQFVTPLLVPLERGWKPASGPRPRYVTTLSLGDDIVKAIGADAGFRHRVYGINGITPPASAVPNARFTLRYNSVYGTSLSRDDIPGDAYDGFYVVAYAAMALGDSPVTGAALANAIHKLVPAPDSPSIEVGPSGILRAFSILHAGGGIDLVGTGSSLDFDLKTGDRSVDLAILCPEVDKHGKAIGSIESGLVYSAQTGAFTGKMRCP